MPSQPACDTRLDFVLPDFVRLSWVSDRAKEIWAPRFKRVIPAWARIELLAGASGVRKCALIMMSGQNVPQAELAWRSRGLSALALESMNGIDQACMSGYSDQGHTSSAPVRLVVATTPEDTQRFREAWMEQDTDSIGEFLGYPACCRARFRERLGAGYLIDHTWPLAVDSGFMSGSVLEIQADGPLLANVLWKAVGVRAVPHLPCRFDCAATTELGRRFLDVGIELGFQDELAWLQEILSWPLEWSALHGLAEIKTPILKISTRTEPTAGKLVVRWAGRDYPNEGAQGLAFPYRKSQRTAITESPAFQRGLVNLGP